MKLLSLLTIGSILLLAVVDSSQAQSLKALIIDGQNNHGAWPKNTAMMKDYLEQTGLFTVDVQRTAFTWQGPHSKTSSGKEPVADLISMYPVGISGTTRPTEEPVSDPDFKPAFSNYDVVISNFGWTAAEWPAETQRALESYMKAGGGLVIVHAANNSFENWKEYNRMIAVGGWGDRSEKDGPFIYYNEDNEFVRDSSPGLAGSHGPQMNFVVRTRESSHPIMKDLPEKWMHGTDELYDRLRGPAENVTVLATAYSDPVKNSPPWNDEPGTGRHEPILLTIKYGKGRVFHTTLGHNDASLESVGFITTLQRGTEWAATGKVTQSIPRDFPTADKVSKRAWSKSK